MGLMTAYHAAPLAASVTVLEKTPGGRPGHRVVLADPVRRNDYLDPEYARLAYESRQLWLDLQAPVARAAAGRLRLPEPGQAQRHARPGRHATRSAATPCSSSCSCAARRSRPTALAQRFPQFAADAGRLDVDAGFVDVPAVTRFLQAGAERPGRAGGRARRGRAHHQVRRDLDRGHRRGPGGVRRPGAHRRPRHQRPARPDARLRGAVPAAARPALAVQVLHPCRADQRDRFTEQVLPVFAYLDIGIYGHPSTRGGRRASRSASTTRPMSTARRARSRSVEDFVAECMPALRGAEVVDVAEASGADVCFYDLVEDDEFIIGPVPGLPECSPGWAGGAPGTSSRPGRAGCWPSSPCSRGPCTTSAASRPAGSPATAAARPGQAQTHQPDSAHALLA